MLGASVISFGQTADEESDEGEALDETEVAGLSLPSSCAGGDSGRLFFAGRPARLVAT